MGILHVNNSNKNNYNNNDSNNNNNYPTPTATTTTTTTKTTKTSATTTMPKGNSHTFLHSNAWNAGENEQHRIKMIVEESGFLTYVSFKINIPIT